MRILVTGGTGFVGSNLVLRLMEEGHDLLITGHDAEQKLPGFRGKYLQPGLLGIDWDALRGIDVLFHQAAINDTTLGDETEMMRANAEASRKLFETVIAGGCRSIVYATSTAVYGDVPAPYRESGPVNPLNAYARSKLALEAIAAETAAANPQVSITGLRYCNVYGPRENHKGKRASMIWQLAQQMKAGNPRIFKMGEQKRDYIYVEDVVRANLAAAAAAKTGVFNCGYGAATTFNDLIAILNEVMGLDRTPEYIDNPYAAAYQSHTECDMSATRAALGFTPKFDVRSGIAAYFQSGFLG
jgi:ADP-L-glycero-D-manno-heptose 6-epimerase